MSLSLNLPQNIRHVQQGYMGCFVACVAMLLGKTYSEAFKLIHPRRKIYPFDNIMIWDPRGGSLLPRYAFDKLNKIGLEPEKIKVDHINDLDKTSIIWLRWDQNPRLMHSVIYEAKTNYFWDPSLQEPLNRRQKRNLQRQKEVVVQLNNYKPPHGFKRKRPWTFDEDWDLGMIFRNGRLRYSFDGQTEE